LEYSFSIWMEMRGYQGKRGSIIANCWPWRLYRVYFWDSPSQTLCTKHGSMLKL
jgi:hypothetical protein